MSTVEYEPILKFWFGEDLSQLDSVAPNYKLWFGSGNDDLIKSKFETTLNKAGDGEYDHWMNEPRGSLALIILFDQFSRNIYRGTPKMYSFDSKAVSVAQGLTSQPEKFNQLSTTEKCFVCLCFEHSENETVFLKGLNTLKALSENGSEAGRKIAASFHGAAVEHHDVLKQFGRYPQRNEFLGRQSTPEEIHFLNTTTIGFVKSVKKSDDKKD